MVGSTDKPQQLPPSVIAVFQLEHPLDISLPVGMQVATIYREARLVECSHSDVGLEGQGSTCCTVGSNLLAFEAEHTDEAQTNCSTELMKRLQQFVENHYYLDDSVSPAVAESGAQLLSASLYGIVKDGCLQRLLVHRKHRIEEKIQPSLVSHNIANSEIPLREQQQRIFIDNSANGMFVLNIDPPMSLTLSVQHQVQWIADNAKFIDANKAFLALFDFGSFSELVASSLFNDDVRFDFATTVRDFITNEFQFHDYLVCFYRGREELWVSLSLSGVIKDGHLVQMLGMMTDVSERVRYSKQMEYRAKHDALTGLPNRSCFIDQVEQAKRLSRPGSRHALMLLDLDGFKEVNDTLGHEMGDYLLKQVGPRLESILPSTKSLLARLGGDEFAVFIESFENIDSVIQLAVDLVAAIKTPFAINELELVVSGSMGIALYPEHADSISSLMRCADVAMYSAKKDSVDYRFYSVEQDHYTVRRLSLIMDVRNAIDNDELRLFYQPIVDLYSQQPVSFEGLIRWQHPVHGMLSPAEFIPLIELTDMIVPVTTWVVETAIKQLAQWKSCDWPFRISVNVSTRNLIDAGFISFIQACLRRYEVDGRYLEIEITESTLMADPEKARKLLQSLAELGVQISIDDYGTGYSSLAYLKSLPINTLKIDRTFISQMLNDSQDQIIVNSTIQLAHNLGLDVTAEGIEELSLVDALLQLGCDKGQGYYFCKPAPIEELESWLLRHAGDAVKVVQ